MKERDAAAATVTKTKWLLEDLAGPLARRPIKEITPAEILQLLQKIEKSGRRETARRLRGVIGSVFRLAIVTLRAETDPTLDLRGALQPPKANGRAAITDEKKFGKLLKRSTNTTAGQPSKPRCSFLPSPVSVPARCGALRATNSTERRPSGIFRPSA